MVNQSSKTNQKLVELVELVIRKEKDHLPMEQMMISYLYQQQKHEIIF